MKRIFKSDKKGTCYFTTYCSAMRFVFLIYPDGSKPQCFTNREWVSAKNFKNVFEAHKKSAEVLQKGNS